MFETDNIQNFIEPVLQAIEGWRPIAGMMNFKYLLLTGKGDPTMHPAGPCS